jgi:transforming growth factor-beta-induced protein
MKLIGKRAVMLAAASAAAILPLTTASAAPAGGDPTKTIAELATATPELSTLVAALGAADLVGPFDSCDDAPTTVFAPTNDAFAAALSALGMTADELLADTELLTSVLTYHVVSGAVDAATVVGLTSATTLNGAAISIEVVDGDVILNGTVKVTMTDIEACNGVVHVIDGVLLPPASGVGEMPATGGSSTPLALGAAVLLVAGAGALLIGRRRSIA